MREISTFSAYYYLFLFLVIYQNSQGDKISRVKKKRVLVDWKQTEGVPHSFWNIGGWDRKLRNRRLQQLKQVHSL